MSKETIVVWFSCGAASAVAAKKTIEKYGDTHIVTVVNNPVDEEDPDNRRFLKDIEKWLGQEIVSAVNSEIGTTSAVDVWANRRFMSGPKGAPCTMLLKKQARYEYELKNHIDWHVLGFTADEVSRHERFTMLERTNVLSVLIDERLTKEECFKLILEAGIDLPAAYTKLGLPNANCIGCVKATSPTYWNHIRKVAPDVFQQRAKQSRGIGCRLVRVKNKRIFLDELDPEAKGLPMKSYNAPECGIFCTLPKHKKS